MRNRKSRVFSLLLVGAMTVGLLAGCSNNGSSDQSDTGNGETKDTIVIATMSETPSVHPADHNATAGSYMNLLTYSTLFNTDMEMQAQPNLVDTYENVSDTVWNFTLKEGIKFHDGTEMKAEDVKASLEWAKTFAEVSLYNKTIETVEVTGDYSFTITTNVPDAILLNNLCHHGNAIVPKALIDSGHDFGEEPIGSGPYKLVEWKRGDSLEFEAFEDYFGGAPAIKHMIWKIIPEGSSRTIALEAGEIDFIVEVETMDYERLKGDDNITVLEYESTEHNWLMLNNEKPGLDNENVRHAMNCAIDKESIVTVALNGLGKAAVSQTPYNLDGYSEENADQYDPEKAKEWMDASGVDPASIELSIICSNDTKKRAGEVIQANLKDVLGIDAAIENMDLATYLSATAEGDYTGAIGGYTSSTMVGYLVGVYHSDSINASNKTRLNDPEVDALIDKASTTIDVEERNGYLEQCSALLNSICSQVPLYQPVALRAYDSNLKGVEVNDSGTIYFEKCPW